MQERALKTARLVNKEQEEALQVYGEAGIYLQSVEDPAQSRWMSKGVCDPVGSSYWSRLLAGSAAL